MPAKKKHKHKGGANSNLSSNINKEPKIKNEEYNLDRISNNTVSQNLDNNLQDLNNEMSIKKDSKVLQTNNLPDINIKSLISNDKLKYISEKTSENFINLTEDIKKLNINTNDLLMKPDDINDTHINMNLCDIINSEINIIKSSNDIYIDLANDQFNSLKNQGMLSDKSKSELKAERREIQEKQRALKEAGLKPAKINQTNPKEVTINSQEKNEESNSIEIKNESNEKSKSQLKAERRALQEQQRALKAAGLKPQPQKIDSSKETKADLINGNIESKHKSIDSKENIIKLNENANKIIKKKSGTNGAISRRKTVSLFGHLQQYSKNVDITKNISLQSKLSIEYIHPEILTIGLQMANGKISGSNCRALATLNALKHVVEDYTTPPDKEFSRELLNHLKPNINFLKQCRTISSSMGNCIKFFKHQTTILPANISEREAKCALMNQIDEFANEKINLAGQIIADEYGLQKIEDGDVILIYGGSSLVLKVLCSAFDKKKLFKVIVMDGRPKMEGKELLRKLIKHGIECTYACISQLTYHMPQVSKVIMGAHGLLANGSVMSTIGSSQVALVASFFNVSVIVMCESYKFCQRVQTDSFVFNELGDPTSIVETSAHLKNRYKDLPHLLPLNLIYDVTPQNLVSMVVTDVGLMPSTSVPVVLRVKNFAPNS